MSTDSGQPAMSIAFDLFKARQKFGAALIYAELAQSGASSAELWCGLGSALLGCRGIFPKSFEVWAAKVFRRGAPTFVGTAYAETVKELCANLPEALGAAPLEDDEIPALIAFLLYNERVIPDAVGALGESAAMVAVMHLGDRASPLYVPLLRYAVEGKLGETTARSALKRIGAFLDWPEMRSSLLVAKQAADPADLGPHLSYVLSRLPAGWDEPHRGACPPYRGVGNVDIELLAAGSVDRDACIALLGEHVAAAPRDARAWLDFAPCMVKKGSPRGVALELKTALEALGATIVIHGYDESLARNTGNRPAPHPEIGTYRAVFFEAKDVELIAEGDTARCALTTTNPAFRAFTDAVNARVLGTPAPDIQIAKSKPPPKVMDELWREYFSDDPLLYLAYEGPAGKAIVPSTAVESFAKDLLSGWKEWRAEKQLVIDRLVRAQAIQARVDAQPRNVDWSAPDPAVLDALEDEDEEESDDESSEDEGSSDEDESSEDEGSSDDDEQGSDDEKQDNEERADARPSPPPPSPPPDPGRTRPAMEALQFIVEQVRKEKRGNFLMSLFFIAAGPFTAYGIYVDREGSGWAKVLFIWLLCALAVVAGVAMLRVCLRPAEKEPEIVLLATRPEQVVWAHVEIKKHNGRHHATALKLYTESGERLELPVPPTTEGAARAMALMKELAPRATLGFSPESEALFIKDPTALRRP